MKGECTQSYHIYNVCMVGWKQKCLKNIKTFKLYVDFQYVCYKSTVPMELLVKIVQSHVKVAPNPR